MDSAVVPWSDAVDTVKEENRSGLSEGEVRNKVRVHHPGGASELQMFEVSIPPDTTVQPHAHATDEIIFVVEGELLLGGRHLGKGSSVLVPRNTLYSFHSGPDGLTFANFRACADDSFVTKEQFLRNRRTVVTPDRAGNVGAP